MDLHDDSVDRIQLMPMDPWVLIISNECGHTSSLMWMVVSINMDGIQLGETDMLQISLFEISCSTE